MLTPIVSAFQLIGEGVLTSHEQVNDELPEEVRPIEKFVWSVYSSGCATAISALRWELFTSRNLVGEKLPPTIATLMPHILRREGDKSDTTPHPCLLPLEEMDECLPGTSLSQSGVSTNQHQLPSWNCSCKKNNLPCTILCKYHNSDCSNLPDNRMIADEDDVWLLQEDEQGWHYQKIAYHRFNCVVYVYVKILNWLLDMQCNSLLVITSICLFVFRFWLWTWTSVYVPPLCLYVCILVLRCNKKVTWPNCYNLILLNVHHMLTFVLILLIDFRLETSQRFPLPWPSCMILTYYRPETYSRLSGMFRNPTIASNIIEVGQVVPEICHFLYFPWMRAAILDFGPYRCLKMCNPRFLFSSYTNEVKSITISLWASNPVKSRHGGLH